MTKRRRGDPGKLNDERKKTICDSIILGMPYTQACAIADVTYTTFRVWINRGEDEMERVMNTPRTTIRKSEKKYVDLVNEVEHAKSKCMQNHLAMITKASKDGTWQASAWMLERRYPGDFGRKDRLETKQEIHGSVDVSNKQQLIDRINRIAERHDPDEAAERTE